MMETQKRMLEGRIIDTIKTVYDPEIPVNIYDLGLIYELNIEDDFTVKIRMTLTSPNCPMAEDLVREVQEKVKITSGVKDLDFNLTFDPPWDSEMISDEAKLELGLL